MTRTIANWNLDETFDSDTGRIAWTSFGAPTAPPVVLLHGTPFSSFIWHDIAPALAHDHRVYVWDMPGYGQSERSVGQDLSLPNLGRVFAALVDHWGLTDPTVIAHDTGGGLALDAHVTHGVSYGRLALVDAVALAPWGSPFFQAVGDHLDVLARIPSTLHEPLLRAYLDQASGRGLHPCDLDGLMAPWSGDRGQADFYRQLEFRRADEAYTDRIKDQYPAITMPVHLYWGTEDDWIPVDRAHELLARIPGSRLRMLPEAGHLSPLDNPAALTCGLMSFLR
ncbi:MAG TPA: alpha/beta hydrolase [Stackebrandtia sp.]|uniref:alpha/beta fold hydrolase n=1 Tax=Stackebrandtia sp. TaxID=2023065 RepID=UPI002D5F1D3B|nr:alpha/beta hydrolase [Stackebrandtia sp.]HZE40090.1 alpha/beta hydrolase [Stackebrandtia sp.]